MKSLERIAATMAALGISVPDARLLGTSKHAFNKTGRNAGKRSKCRLKIARGAGTISAKADFGQLMRAGRRFEAAQLASSHYRQCGELLLPRQFIDEWMLEEVS